MVFRGFSAIFVALIVAFAGHAAEVETSTKGHVATSPSGILTPDKIPQRPTDMELTDLPALLERALADRQALEGTGEKGNAGPLLGYQYFQSLPGDFAQSPSDGDEPQAKSIDITRVVLDVQLGQKAGSECRLFGSTDRSLATINTIEPWFYPDSFESLAKSILSGTGYRMPGQGDLFGPDLQAASTDYQLGARIAALDVRYCTDYDSRTYQRYFTRLSVEMNVEWQVYSVKEQRVVRKVQTFGHSRANLAAGELLRTAAFNAFTNSTIDLVSDRGFNALVFQELLEQSYSQLTPLGINGAVFDDEEALDRKAAGKGHVIVQAGKGKADGFLISSEGYILTTASIFTGDYDVDVTVGRSRKKVKGQFIRFHPLEDVALIKIPAQEPPLIPLPLKRPPYYADTPVNILKSGRTTSTSTKKTSGTIKLFAEMDPGHTLIVADINHGRKIHGLPLLDTNGNVLGIKIRDFSSVETSYKNQILFLTIGDALNALKLFVMSDDEGGEPVELRGTALDPISSEQGGKSEG